MPERAWSDVFVRWSAIGLSRVRALQLLITLLLGLVTVLIVAGPSRDVNLTSPALYVALHTVALLVAAAIAVLGYAASRTSHDGAAMLDGAAFLILAVSSGAQVVVAVAGGAQTVGLDPASPRATPLWVAAMVRVAAAALLLLAASASATARVARSRRPLLILAGPAMVTTALGLVALGNVGVLEPMIASDRFLLLPSPGEAPLVTGVALVATNGVGAALLAAAAWLRPRRPGGALPRIWLAAALTIGIFYELHVALHPAEIAGRITTATLLQLAFFVTLLAALQATRAADFRLARAAHDRRRRLRRADLVAAAQSERLRLARELHDGLVQALVAIRSQHAHASSLIDQADETAQAAAQRVGDELADALAEARRTIDFLRNGPPTDPRLFDELGPRLRGFAERHGYTLEFRSGESLVGVSGLRAAEVLRIVDEALANIRRHADATNLRVTAARAGEQLILTITDNGRGFDPARTARGHGITGMHERAEVLGGRLTIHSARGEGTQLRLMVPLQIDDDEH